ncbi:MAG: hypothetical protein IMX00_01425 [Limnochordales bacterium]|nr:hypothetical protein [Limnochordales bacterium]
MWPLTLALLILLGFFLLVSEIGYWTGVCGRRLLRAWRDRMDSRPVGEGAVLVVLLGLIGLGFTILVRLLTLPPWGESPDAPLQAPPGSIGQLAALFARELPVRKVLLLTLAFGLLAIAGLVVLERVAGRWLTGLAHRWVVGPLDRWVTSLEERWLAGRRMPGREPDEPGDGRTSAGPFHQPGPPR